MNFQLLNGHVPVKILVELKGKALLFGLTSDIRLAHFLSQVSHESGGFLKTEENLNYSEKRLLQVFPKYFNERNSIIRLILSALKSFLSIIDMISSFTVPSEF